ncbi:MAG: adenine nucleotide alpha hydrolase [Betaproteobacteria bacterium]
MNEPIDAAAIASRMDAVEKILRSMGSVAIAVSGGVDSMTLATFAHRALGGDVTMFHATSPAVPGEATARTRDLGTREGWNLTIIDAGEFQSADYMANPVNRCFHCKTSLYGAITPHTVAQVVSGANLDDLGEYRPGLIAAKDHNVRHPWVEAQVDKKMVRNIARHLGLPDLAELPSSPCLSSRIETGIGIDAQMLACVHATEKLVTGRLDPKTVRCRVRAEGVVIELDADSLAAMTVDNRTRLADEVKALFRAAGFDYLVSFATYRVGSAFLHPVKLVRTPTPDSAVSTT